MSLRLLILGALLAVSALAEEKILTAATDEQRAKAVSAVKLPNGFRYEVLAMGNIPEPLYLQFCPDGRLWLTGRRGDIWAYDFQSKTNDSVAHLKVCWEPIPGRESNERGLHGIEFDPNYKSNGFVYLYYSPVYEKGWSNRVARFTVDNPEHATGFKEGSEKVLMEWVSSRGFHQGGALQYNQKDRCLYITVGDNNVSSDTRQFFNDPLNPPQVLTDLRGKTLRINLDGSIPKDNPFVGRSDANPAIYTFGHRNPYTLTVDQETGRTYVGEVGFDRAEDWEEVNWLKPGGNYGWPRCMGNNLGVYGGDCPIADATVPFITWIHVGGANATVGPIYRQQHGTNDFPQEYVGGMFYADWVRKWIRFATINQADNTVTKTEPFVASLTAGVLAMQLGPDGALYMIEYGGWFTGAASDKLSRIVPVKQ